ncbi:peroxisomal membrane protein PEX14, partial [Aspergillus vadensis CBS 113365]
LLRQTMADSKPKPSSIPSWQQPNNASNPNNDNSESTSSPTSDDSSRSALIEQAAKFLEDESIRDAPTDRKVTFLQYKGLREDEINTLLGISSTPKASDTTEEEEKTASPDTTPPSSTEPAPAPEQANNASASSTTQPTPSSSITTPTPSPTPPKTTTTTTRDIPPIITYPEFLSTPTKPPPLVTLRSVLYTLYGAAGLSASFYGASEYLIKPMLSNLTSARQELASTATSNLHKLNEKLEQNVSVIPESLKNKTANTENDSSSTDTESITSDPTELFHRDVATQTATSDFAATYNNKTGTDKDSPADPTAAVTDHLKRLESIRSQLRDCSDTEKESSTLDSGMRTRLNELHHYLDGLIYSKPGFNPLSGYGMYSTPGMDSGSGAATGVGKGEEDAIANFRAEIRGVKGALLSARNFPAGRGGRIG